VARRSESSGDEASRMGAESSSGAAACARVRGRIIDRASGSGVVGAKVLAATAMDEAETSEATSGENGAYDLEIGWRRKGEATRSSWCGLDVRAQGYAVSRESVALEVGGTHEADVVLDPGFSVELEVVDDNGAPLAGAKVSAILNDEIDNSCGWPLSWWGGGSHVTDASGRFRLDGLSTELGYGKRWVLAISRPDRVELLVDRPELLSRTDGLLSLRVVLEPGHTLSGTLLVPRGEAAERTTVIAFFQDQTGAKPGCHAIERQATLDPHGGFHLKGLAVGEHILRIQHDAALTEARKIIVPLTEPLSIVLTAGRRIDGQVLGADGAPLAGVHISLDWGAASAELVSDGDGRFVCASTPIDQRVLVTATDRPPGDCIPELLGWCVLEAGITSARPVIDARERVEISGQTVDRATGLPLPLETMIDGEEATVRASFRVCCDERNGRFTMRLPPGRYALGVRAQERWEERYAALFDLEVTPGEACTLVLPLLAAFVLCVIVRDDAGSPLCDAAVEVIPRPLWSRHYSGRTKADGRVSLDCMIPDVGRLRVDAEGYATVMREIDFAHERGPVTIILTARLERA